MSTLKLPNGKPVDVDMVEQALEDSSGETNYFLNMETGEVIWFSSLADGDFEEEEVGQVGPQCVRIEPLSSHEEYQWMEEFAEEVVAPKDAQLAEKLAIALNGKGAFRRFKDVMRNSTEEWLQAWYKWREDHLTEAVNEWFASISET